jgi:NAD(P)-dependent dehydrogenase (short-subunit alcohol dehydrogenase family)
VRTEGGDDGQSGRERRDGKVAVTFGGGRGIGRGCCLAIAAEGAAVVVADAGAGDAGLVAKEIVERGGRSVAAACDVVDAAQVASGIGPAIAFLVSDDARYLTGQTILLDGGESHL